MGFWEIIGLILHGTLQQVLLWVPLISPFQEEHAPPWWWHEFWSGWDWTGNLDSDRRPTQAFIEKYLIAAFLLLKKRILEEASWNVSNLGTWFNRVLGALPGAFNSFTSWIYSLSDRIGNVWSKIGDTVGVALSNLFNMLPLGIRERWVWWDRLFDDIVDRATDWARARYDQTRRDAKAVWDWWRNLGHILGVWWQENRGFLDEFRRDPYGFIVRRLGAAWNWLVDFRQDSRNWVKGWLGQAWNELEAFAGPTLQFYYGLYQDSRNDLFDFLQDPLQFLWDRAEDFLNRKLV